MSTIEIDLRATVEVATPRLLALSESEAGRPPAPGKWSPKQVLGHLIDSASNNHQRFVRAQLTNDLVFLGYEQEAWVAIQRYQAAPWPELVEFWRLFNLHLGRVIEAIPAGVRMEARPHHNLHQLAWQTVPPTEPTTLEYFMRDYVGHLRHHLNQVLGSL